MAKLILNDVQNIYGNTTAAETALNANFAMIEVALDNTLSRDGTIPNQMTASLDMNSNRVTNLAPGINPSDAATISQLQAIDSPNLEIDDLVDVSFPGNGPTVGDLFTFDGTTWTSTPASAIGGVNVINDLQDVVITTPVNQQAIVYDGAQWVNTTLPSGVTDHGALTGLADDDHVQYFNTGRGDVRYAQRSTPVLGANSIAGGGDLSVPRTFSLVNDQASPAANHFYGTSATAVRGWLPLPQGITDHGVLGGLADDDHTQYFNTARGDARYSLTSHLHTQYADRLTAQTITGSWTFSTVPRVTSAGSVLYHGDATKTSGRVTVSSDPPSGGNDGDIWFVVV